MTFLLFFSKGSEKENLKMSKKPPNRPGITFEIGARLEALDYLQKWYGRPCSVCAKSIIVLSISYVLVSNYETLCSF